MSGRRKHQEEPENHERWLVSYADFITLLFAFFVVMYSVSSINEGKYRVLSDVLVAAFRSPAQSLEPIQVGKLARTPSTDSNNDSRLNRPKFIPELRPMPFMGVQRIRRPIVKHFTLPLVAAEPIAVAAAKPKASQAGAPAATERPDHLDEIVTRLQDTIPELISANLIRVRRSGAFIEVEIGDNILFPSGSSVINESAQEPLRKIAVVLKDVSNPIQVEGFTDNVPIKTPIYPSNWELSAARAASVVHLLMEAEIRPERMAAIGYGEHRPIGDNATEEGRTRNRRVVLVIEGDGTPQQQNDNLKTPGRGTDVAVVKAGLSKTR
jgi:chemotaxis protein MotB